MCTHNYVAFIVYLHLFPFCVSAMQILISMIIIWKTQKILTNPILQDEVKCKTKKMWKERQISVVTFYIVKCKKKKKIAKASVCCAAVYNIVCEIIVSQNRI